jgi:hypothetical protein
MLEKLRKFGLGISEIEKLRTFKSRCGFELIDEEEFSEMQNHFAEFAIFRNIAAILTDKNSNYWCVNIEGPMRGMICYLNHEEADLGPRFKSISNFLNVIDQNPNAYDIDDLDETSFDFPNSVILEDFEERKEIIKRLKDSFYSENDEELKQQIAFSIIALTSIDEIKSNIYPMLDDENMYIQEKAIQILSFHKYKPAKDKLTSLKTTAKRNGLLAIEIALKKLL